MGAQIRRLENTLTTIGTGIVAMAIWQTIKIILQLTLLNQMEKNEETTIGVIIAISITVILGLIECYIGFSARSEGKGKKKSGVYLVWTGLYLAAFFAVLVYEIYLIIVKQQSVSGYGKTEVFIILLFNAAGIFNSLLHNVKVHQRFAAKEIHL